VTTAAHRRRASALRAVRRRHDRESSGHAAAALTWYVPRRKRPALVAGALADAMLTTGWQFEEMLAAVRTVIGGRSA
jgi:hypothetical protein